MLHSLIAVVREPEGESNVAPAVQDPGRVFKGINFTGDAELVQKFSDCSADARKVLVMASKMGIRPELIDRVAARLKQVATSSDK